MQNYPKLEEVKKKAKSIMKRGYSDTDEYRNTLRYYVWFLESFQGFTPYQIHRELKLKPTQVQRLLREQETQFFVAHVQKALRDRGVDRLTPSELWEFVEQYWQDKDETEGEI
jgi:hypothetical protein